MNKAIATLVILIITILALIFFTGGGKPNIKAQSESKCDKNVEYIYSDDLVVLLILMNQD